MKKLLLLLAVSVIPLSVAVEAIAQGGSRQSFTGTFTATAPGSPTGYRLAIDYRNPADPEAKPHSVAEVVQRLHRGAVIDTSVPDRCEASDAELIARGASACPAGTRIGGGELDADTGTEGGPLPRVIQNRVTVFNARDALILFTESTNTPGRPIRTSGRSTVRDGEITSRVPPIPGSPPPDPFLAIKRVRVSLEQITEGSAPRRRSYITTPLQCPDSGRWTNSATFTYRDGVSQTVRSPSPCRPARTTRGTPADDEIVGTGGADIIRCGSGDDRVDGRGGEDVIDCGSGDDVILGGSGSDRLYGGSGGDRIAGGRGDDRLFGQSGDDRLHGGTGHDRIFPGTGRDSVVE